jgi:hypothetical protein
MPASGVVTVQEYGSSPLLGLARSRPKYADFSGRISGRKGANAEL